MYSVFTGKAKGFANYKTFLMAVLMLWVATSCNKTPQHAKHIPKQASAVVAIDTKKLAWDIISFDDIFGKNTDTTSDETGKKLQEAGIDFLSTSYVFSTGALDKAPVSALLPLSDAAKFKAFLETFDKEHPLVVKEENGFRVAGNNDFVVMFDDKLAIVATLKNYGEAQLKTHANTLFTLAEENSLAESNTYFKGLLEHGGALSFWVSLKDAMPSEATANNPAADQTNKALTGRFMTATLDFEKGKAVLKSDFYSENEADKEYGKLLSQPINKDLLADVPSDKPMGVVALKLDVPLLRKLMQKVGVSMQVEGGLTMAGVSPDDFFGMLSGDVIVAATEAAAEMNGTPQVFVNLGISNNETCNKVLGILSSQSFIKKENDYFVGGGVVPAIYSLIPRDKKLMFASSAKMRDLIVGNKAPKFKAEVGENAMYFLLDFDVFTQQMSQFATDYSRLANKYVKSFEATAIQKSEKQSEAVFSLHTKPENESSWKALAEYGQEVKKLDEAQRKQWQMEEQEIIEADTASVAVPLEEEPVQ
ncbi:protein of unknown function [Flexibacter flexilis DSM 6793]|uniref:DUF4836 family protein n=1 Tax=Flexibacter flexilis DSM 6793 TaxID=927664 RepID=A0A1I1NA83_9BACT|nr:DUF4836 family protein [Flexibacter flexilis]SFC91663.1 protein of unknown function [Flexibacter flexilis DSM 6793]